MKIQGEHAFDAPRELVWRALLDPAVLSRVLPGTEKLEQVGEDQFRGLMNVQVGPVKGQFQGTLQLTDRVALEGYHMKLNGSGPSGFMNGEGEIRLVDSPGAPGGTVLRYDLETQVGGRVAGVGQRVLESSAKSITRQGLEGLARELQVLSRTSRSQRLSETSRSQRLSVPEEAAPEPMISTGDPAAAVGAGAPAEPATPVVAAVAAPAVHPTQTEMAARVAADIARDLVPPRQRPWLIGGALLALVVIGLLLARACGA